MSRNYTNLKHFRMTETRTYTPSAITVSNIESHWHSFFEFELFLDGNGIVCLNDTHIPIKRGFLYYVTIPDTHSAKIERKCNILNVSFDIITIENESLSSLIANTNSFYTFLDEEEINYFSALHSMLCSEFESTLPLSNQHAVSILETLLYFVLKKHNKFNMTTINSGSIQKAIKYINLNFTDKISLQDMADTIFVTREHLSREFRKYVGQNFSDYILNLRLKYAKNLLATTQLSIIDIANEIGLGSLTYFSRIFKKKFGISPLKYRNKMKSSYKIE